MYGTTKITLSDKELSLVKDPDWILTKQVIIGKVYALFAECIPGIKEDFKNSRAVLPDPVRTSVPKINKGENYLQLPYVMLDYPRYFSGKDIFAIRTMFWWGNFFSITLHLSGEMKTHFEEVLIKNRTLITDGFFMGVHEDQWQHHFEIDNFLPVQHCTIDQQLYLLKRPGFIKLALKFDLEEWNNMPALLRAGYQKIISVLS